ncbi:MAG: glycoside hydrolase family 3 C-terminal domain-containing protein [Reichenbachiella sp.]
MKYLAALVVIAVTAIYIIKGPSPTTRPSTKQISNTTSPVELKVDSVMALMTLEEKIGQMNQYNAFWDATGPLPNEAWQKDRLKHLKQGLVGSMLNAQHSKNISKIKKLQEIVVNETRLGIPMMFGLDVIHGFNTTFPIPLAESSSWDLEAMRKSAAIAAKEATAVGVNWTFAPMVDISRDARWGRVMEGAGEDPYYGSLVAAARVKGFQGDNLSDPNTIAATVKHFAGYGFAEAGRDYNTVDVGTVTLHNTILPPFKAAVDAGTQTLMNGFNALNGIPATGDSYLLRDLLKGKWGFDGFVISDWASIMEMTPHGYARDLKHAAEIAANAGSDMDMQGYAYVKHLKDLVNEGKVSIEKVNDAVRRILRVKFRLGLFEDPYKYCDPEKAKKVLKHPDHLALALEVAKKSIVLLKNENHLLPLKKTQKKIAVIGSLSNDKDTPVGNWAGAADNGTMTSVIEGLSKYTKNITYAKGCGPWTGDSTHGFAEAIALAKKSDVVIMTLGEHAWQSGEAKSRSNPIIPGKQLELLKELYKVNKNIVAILMNGRPLIIPWLDAHIPSILEAWHLGSTAGDAIAQVLFGDYNPSGKLTMSFPRSLGQIPIYYNVLNTGRPGPTPDNYYSRYIDEVNQPLYVFGHGLSYTTFAYSDLIINDSNPKEILVTVSLKNSGSKAGEEVAQLYIRDHFASVVRPLRELKGFKKVLLQPGEMQKLVFTLTEAELGFFNAKGEYVVEPGAFDIMVGTSSKTVIKSSFILK